MTRQISDEELDDMRHGRGTYYLNKSSKNLDIIDCHGNCHICQYKKGCDKVVNLLEGFYA